ncbi:MAG: hypothetical protein ACRCX8_18515 [Sarcina sp.]
MLETNLCKYAKQKGLNKEEYKTLKENFKTIGIAIYNTLMVTPGGIYKPFNSKVGTDRQTQLFINLELKKLGIEFTTDYTMYRK